MPEPLVSVCLPVWNGAQYLQTAISSVLQQSYPSFELIICDDGSTDGSQEIALNFAQNDSRIKCFQNTSRLGLFQNYNACISYSQGEFVKPFAQDDLLYDNAIKELVQILLKNSKAALVSCYKTAIDKGGDKVEKTGDGLSAGLHTGLVTIEKCLQTGINLIGEPVTVMFRRRCIGSGFNGSYHSLGDIEYWFRIIQHNHYYSHPTELVAFRSHPSSTTSQLLTEMNWVLDFMQLGKEYSHVLDEMGLSLEDYYCHCLESIGGLIDQLAVTEKLEVKELTGYKEVAYYALRRLGKIAQDHKRIHDSLSWRITRPLREFNRLLHKPRLSLFKNKAGK